MAATGSTVNLVHLPVKSSELCLFVAGALSVNRRSGAGEVVDLADLKEQQLNDVVSDEFKSRIPKMVPVSPRCTTLAGNGSNELEVISSENTSARDEENMEFTIEIYCKERAEDIRENRDLSAKEGEDIFQASIVNQEESMNDCQPDF